VLSSLFHTHPPTPPPPHTHTACGYGLMPMPMHSLCTTLSMWLWSAFNLCFFFLPRSWPACHFGFLIHLPCIHAAAVPIIAFHPCPCPSPLTTRLVLSCPPCLFTFRQTRSSQQVQLARQIIAPYPPPPPPNTHIASEPHYHTLVSSR